MRDASDLPMPAALDLSFLDARISPAAVPKRPVNVYEILRDGWRETRVDMTLQFFLDPNERHGLGTLAVDALLRLLDRAPLLDEDGPSGSTFDAEQYYGSFAWELQSQSDYIDVLAVNRELDIAVVLENKIRHDLNNPLEKYTRRALAAGVSTAIVAVLAPEERQAPDGQEAWLSASITYANFGTALKQSPALLEHLLAPSDLDQRRSLDLLQQFLEVRTGGPSMSDLSHEELRLGEWRDLLEAHSVAIDAFRTTQREMQRLIKERSARLAPIIAERLAEEQFVVDWEAHGGRGDEVWNAYHFPDIAWSIELKLATRPTLPLIFVQSYPGRTYRQIENEPLDLTWASPDEELVEAFLLRVQARFTAVAPNKT
ncbi:PD-(D/E)XK nuclease family protein [Leucobacter sp. USCH14]|uniref:PD-(D/E)XK nuclease family protein n=1 Tax=Leucobacter sp. USCH14 TaxID=3024838 RepID=UPI0030A8AB66